MSVHTWQNAWQSAIVISVPAASAAVWFVPTGVAPTVGADPVWKQGPNGGGVG